MKGISPMMPVDEWIRSMQELCQPEAVEIVYGTKEQEEKLLAVLLKEGQAIALNPSLRPHSFLFRSDPRDVARVEEKTWICSKNAEEAGPLNHFCDPEKMKERLRGLFSGCMRGRTMYVIPFRMGPAGSPLSLWGVEISDSAYVGLHMLKMTYVPPDGLASIRERPHYIPCMHSVGVPLKAGEKSPVWPCQPDRLVVAHFPESKEIWSFGSGYGGNALLAKKCVALRIASKIAQENGWLAEHMLIMGVTSPEGVKKYIAAAFPSSCGKTNLAMMQPKLPGWKVETIGDDIAWLWKGEDGRLYAMNPEAGFFGVAPGTSFDSNPVAMQTIMHDTLFTNVAMTQEGDVYWEKMGTPPPEGLIDWEGKPYGLQAQAPAAHPNARFTVSISQCPVLDPLYYSPQGVPISAILFGGRRSEGLALVTQAKDWEEGVLMGALLCSERTAAQHGQVGAVRHDPFAMLPFCGYDIGQYFEHWLSVGRQLSSPPAIFSVNWFLKNSRGEFRWPGFGDNIRVIDWVFKRLDGKAQGQSSFRGIVPLPEELDWTDLAIKQEDRERLIAVEPSLFQRQKLQDLSYLRSLGKSVPETLVNLLDSP